MNSILTKNFNFILFLYHINMKIIELLKNIFSLKHLLTIIGLLGTGIGAFGGMPQPPKLLIKITEIKIVQWLLVYVLIWQGAGGYDELLSLYGTFILFVLYYSIEKLAENKKVYDFLGIEYENDKEKNNN